MPANTSFKVVCPSCEAGVPIRDPNLIGKKVDCPKCKYRFVVEDPNAEPDRPTKKGMGKAAAKKKGGSNVLVLSVVAGVAVVLLAAGAYFLFLSGGDSKPTPPTGGVASVPPVTPLTNPNPPPTDPGTTPPDAPPTEGPGAVTPPAPTPPAPTPPSVAAAPPLPPAPGGVYRNLTNLLPNDAQSVLTIDMDRLRNSTIGQQAFESRIGFAPNLFKTKIGIGIEEMTRFVRAENVALKWSFNVIRTRDPVKFADLQRAMRLKFGPKSPIRGRVYFELAPNDLVDNLSIILQSELETKEAKAPPTNPKLATGSTALVLLDPTTLILGNLDMVEEFLNANGQFELKSRLAPDAGGDPTAGGDLTNPTPPAGGDQPPPPSPGGRGGRGGGDGAEFTNRGTYLTIEPSLKAMMDRLEEGDQVIAAAAQRLQADPKIAERVRDLSGLPQFEVRGMNVLGVALQALNNERFKGQVVLDWIREADAQLFETELRKLLQPAALALGLYLGGPTTPLRIDVDGGSGGGMGGGDVASGIGGGGGRGIPTGPAGRSGGPGATPPPGGSDDGSGVSNPNDPNNPNNPNNQPGASNRSTIGLTRRGRSVQFTIELVMTERAYDRVYALSEGAVIRMKGMVEMADTRPRWFELAAASKGLPQDSIVPRATFAREDALNVRLGRSFPPNQRVSWMVGLLPHLGQEDLFGRIDKKKSWRDEENLKQGAVLIPQFLNPLFPRPSWRAHVPSLGVRDQGATHYVGMAGVGLDAADYRFGDKAVEKKLGLFGYNRQTSLKDVSDGLSNTIYVIQVPPTYPRPWIAGGGATVQGVPETNSVRPFVAQHGNKRGTYAIMADGSVRFISDSVSDEVFKAMCTIKGGDDVKDLTDAPKVDPKGNELRTVSPADIR